MRIADHHINRRGILALGASALLNSTSVQAREILPDADGDRVTRSFNIRVNAARACRRAGTPDQAINGDELQVRGYVGSFSKGLPHNALGEVDRSAYESLVGALSGAPAAFEAVPLGGSGKLVNPQSAFAFDLEGLDSHQFTIGPPPRFGSAERAAEAVELYWMSLLRDVRFTEFGQHSLAAAASAELSRLGGFRGPRVAGAVTPQTLFRGFTAGDLLGPFTSQFLLQPTEYGSIHLDNQITTALPPASGGADYLTTASSWLAAQDGRGPFEPNRLDSTRRHIRNARDLATYVHFDVLFEGFLNASLWLSDHKAPFSPSNPYRTSRNQAGFVTFGAPTAHVLMAEAASRALKAVWYQKWSVHRALRPEEYGGRVHFTKAGQTRYDVHADVLSSEAVDRTIAQNGTALLPQAYPEGAPLHPSYASGHAAVAGACATILKAIYDESARISALGDVVEAAPDGLSLVRYMGADRDLMTVGSELDKLASNIASGRNMAGIHWRSDYADGLLLGEAVAISILREQKSLYNESFDGFTLTTFDGSRRVLEF